MKKFYFGASWAITSACNYKCEYCYRHKNNKTVNPCQAKVIIDKLYSMGCRKLSLSGGEPLLWYSKEKVIDLLNYIKNKGIITEIITNGYYLKASDFSELSKCLDVFTIDVDSINSDIQVNLGRPANHFDNAKILYKEARKYGIKIKLNTVVTSLNQDYILDMADFVKDNGFYKWKLYQFMPIMGFTDEKKHLLLDKQKFSSLMTKLKNSMLGSGTWIVTENNDEMAGSYINIDQRGCVFTNQIMDNGLLKQHNLGNVMDLSIDKIMRNEHFDRSNFIKFHEIKVKAS